MTPDKLRKMYIDFFKSKGHAEIPGSSLIPENDPTVLFTTAGMHPLVPYLLGENHPAGKRLTDYQKCIRTGDIDSVGDPSHLTFFEMLGNWSLGDYFKKESLQMSFEFLTSKKWLGFDPNQLSVTVFAGDKDAPRDEESIAVWKALGIPEERIFALPKEDNWWGPAGETGPCGPDSEIFVDTGKPACSCECKPGCHCGKYFEVWNNVFMEYNKNKEGQFEKMQRQCVDTGMGIERTVTMIQRKKSVYETEIFQPTIRLISTLCNKRYGEKEDQDISFRIISDHIRTATFILGDERSVTPSNIGQGYILRRLIRRAVRHGIKLGIEGTFLAKLADLIIQNYQEPYPILEKNRDLILTELTKEEEKFSDTLQKGLHEFEKLVPNLLKNPKKMIPGRIAFKLYDTYGFPVEMTEELAVEKGLTVDKEGFEEAFKNHQETSRQGAEKAFKGGLADHSEATTALHTATHLLHKALHIVLGDHVQQKGSNITAERLRFDFCHPDKMTPKEIQQVEDLVNEQIAKALPVTIETMPLEEAKKAGAYAFFGEKYDQEVKVYTIGNFSKEVCGGPHVENLSQLGRFKIQKEQSSSAGVRRIRAILEK